MNYWPDHGHYCRYRLFRHIFSYLLHSKYFIVMFQVYNDLDGIVKEYTKVVIRISEDMKLARLEHAVN